MSRLKMPGIARRLASLSVTGIIAVGVIAAGLTTIGPVRAQDAGEITFWTSVRDSKNPAEFQAYIDAYPHGRFVELARLRIIALGATPVAPAPAAPAAANAPGGNAAKAPANAATHGAATAPAATPAAPTPVKPVISALPVPLGPASVRFPGPQPLASTEPSLADVVSTVRAKTKLACGAPQAYHWDVKSWDQSGFDHNTQGIVADLQRRGFATRPLEAGLDNLALIRVDNPKPTPADRSILLTFYLQEKSDLFLIVCTTG